MSNEKIYIGTSGYDYLSWRGSFYPNNLKRQDFLSFYATKFNTVELNFTFYSMPNKTTCSNLISKSENKLSFCIKANRILTHEISNNYKIDCLNFIKNISPFIETNVLGAILFQFPQSFHYTIDNRFYLSKLLTQFATIPTVVEFRHISWCKTSVFEGLEKFNSSLVFCDMPSLKNLPNGLSLSTPFVGNFAYLRLHGRNQNAWYAKSNSPNGADRYTYDYSENELSQFVPIIKFAQSKNKKTYIFFNNHPNGCGAKNAMQLQNLII